MALSMAVGGYAALGATTPGDAFAAATHTAKNKATNPAAGLVLTPHDVGSNFKVNGGVSGPRTLTTVSADDKPAIRLLLKRYWAAGMEAAFNGRRTSTGIVSTADVFRRGAPVERILAAWQGDAKSILHGTTLPAYVHAPGSSGVTMRGVIYKYEVLLYMWRSQQVIASVELVGTPGHLSRSLLETLANDEESRIVGRPRPEH